MNDPQPRRLGRSLAAVLGGFAVIVVLSTLVDVVMHASGVFPAMGEPMSDALWVWATAYRVVISVFGCWLAARWAPYRPMLHALVLGWLGVLASLVGVIVTWSKGPGFGPKWYPISLVLVAIPCAWIGGKIHAMRSGRA